MEEVFVCPFCGRDDIYRKCSFTRHVKHCRENPDRVESILKGRTLSDEHKQKISEYQNRPEVRQKQSESHKGKTHSAEVKQKISEASKRMWENIEHKQKICEALKGKNKGKTRSKETRQKLSEAHKGRTPWIKGKTLSEETRQKLSETHKGKKLSDESRKKLSEAVKKAYENPEVRQKIYNTKKQNNSFNSSKIEEQLTEYFISNNIDFKTQYKSDVYPFMCDFYFPDKDFYVEIQGTWTHGGKPYISTDEDCIEQLELWKSKNKPFYLNAIDTWTNRDVRKRNWAKEHKLNWTEIFSDNLDVCIKEILKLL